MSAEPTTQLLLVLLAPAIGGIVCLYRRDLGTSSTPQPATTWVRKGARDYLYWRRIRFRTCGDLGGSAPDVGIVSHGGWGDSVPRYLATTSPRFPELYEGTLVSDWVDFLRRSQVAVIRGGRIRLTPEGREFLESLVRHSALHR